MINWIKREIELRTIILVILYWNAIGSKIAAPIVTKNARSGKSLLVLTLNHSGT